MKSKSKKKIGIAALVLVIILTTTVSLVLWATGILGNNNDGGGDINIGKGRKATTTVNLSDPDISEDELIPLTVTPIEGECHTITITFEVNWLADDDPAGIVAGAEGILTLECVSIMTEKSSIELKGEKVDGDAPLFLINLGGVNDDGVYDIIGSADIESATSTTVTITIQLNEPVDEEQYLKIAGEKVLITFNFEVSVNE